MLRISDYNIMRHIIEDLNFAFYKRQATKKMSFKHIVQRAVLTF